MWKLLCRFPVTIGFIVVILGLGAYQLILTDHAVMVISLLYAAVLYGVFVKAGIND